ncbi:hypothetical protein KKF34_02805 [Myxococcota bacterium]|nr:hypothetical protein [Myxococcota bacterium]MBU1379575.1 hypothetical protein [Myxococcota bacterium]MBU1495792.1 hypothetical protein [Myxococcota bacterium]
MSDLKSNILLYDKQDFQLLETINIILENGKTPDTLKKLFDTSLHPRGIKELGAPQTLRIAVAMIELLGTLKKGTPEERVHALRAVRSETLHEQTYSLKNNVARVLMRIMKKIVRSRGKPQQQLRLIHDFRQAATGKPRIVRTLLNKYHLFEMPEEWNQLAFDHHVHDANSKGRKTPTHLVMDAWIKGIRFLGVIYYNFIRPEVAAELLEAAEVMGIEVRIGVELAAKLHNRYAQLVWSPMGFFNWRDFVDFLHEPEVEKFMQLGRGVREYKKIVILQLLERYNSVHRFSLEKEYGIPTSNLTEEMFNTFVDRGHPSLVHIAEFIHKSIFPAVKSRATELKKDLAADSKNSQALENLKKLDALIPEKLVELYFRPELNPGVCNLSHPSEVVEVPQLLNMTTSEILDLIDTLPCRSRITLNPSNLTQADCLEVLYDGGGRITHIEIYNSKDWAHHLTEHRVEINNIRLIINNQNVIELKRIVRERLIKATERDKIEGTNQRARIQEILGNLPKLLSFYQHQRLRSRMGTDSIGRSRTTPGMGMVVLPTIPWRARRAILKNAARLLPVVTTPILHSCRVLGNKESLRRYDLSMASEMKTSLSRVKHKATSWSSGSNTTTLSPDGNIAALGGMPGEPVNGFMTKETPPSRISTVNYINSGILNATKVLIGFIPAFLTFYFTKSWWVLAWFGAPIWFAITGGRNIIQSVVGGGGLFRTSLLEWKDFVNWSRVCDSLLFTGFSVPLLDFLVKDLLLNRSMGITPATNVIALYSVMALANGIYISSHNLFRGLPMAAVIGNFFRTILSIPVAIFLNWLILRIILSTGTSIVSAQAAMFLWAAVISKFASDMVAAIIEGSADRRANLELRMNDYREKLQHIYKNYNSLELQFPETDIQELMANPEKFAKTLQKTNHKLLKQMVINSLDLLYFWMYQPRAESAMKIKSSRMGKTELKSLVLFTGILKCKHLVSQMLLKGLVGRKFERALAFYLSRSDEWLQKMQKLLASK